MKFTPKTLDAYELMHDGILSLARAERNGIYCDVDYCKGMIKHLDRQITRMESKLKDSEFITKWRRQYGQKFNMGSNTQLADMLYNVMGIEPTAYTEKGTPSTDADALSSIDIPEIQDMLRIKELEKAKTTYLEGFLREQVDGVIHTNFNLHLTRSYRPSTDSPNLANVPSRNPEIKQIVRNAIKARPGHKLVCADFKGIEVGISAAYNKDPALIKYVNDKSLDMHRDMAMMLYMLEKTQVTKQIRH
ncbi:MAG: DNA polymerase, partial [Patescibacteria group bacterium]